MGFFEAGHWCYIEIEGKEKKRSTTLDEKDIFKVSLVWL